MNIGSYLETIRKKINEKYAYKDIVVLCIQQTTGILLARDVIKQKHGVVYIEAHPLIKAEITLKKETLLNLLKEKGVTYSDIK